MLTSIVTADETPNENADSIELIAAPADHSNMSSATIMDCSSTHDSFATELSWTPANTQLTCLTRTRSYSAPFLHQEIETENLAVNQNPMHILLDIQARMSKIEECQSETITATTMRSIFFEAQKPVSDALQQVNSTIQNQELKITEIENKQLALESKMSIIQQEITNHSNASSAEYADLKSTQTDELETLKDEIKANQTKQKEINDTVDDFSKDLALKIEEIESSIREQKERYERLVEDHRHTPKVNDETRGMNAQSQTERTHQDDMMRKSIILEGVPEQKDEYLLNVILNISMELDIDLFPCEVSQIRRVGPYKREARRPRPVRVTFIGEIKRDTFLQRKKGLMRSDMFHTCMIHPDEPASTRQFKAHLRYAASQARE